MATTAGAGTELSPSRLLRPAPTIPTRRFGGTRSLRTRDARRERRLHLRRRCTPRRPVRLRGRECDEDATAWQRLADLDLTIASNGPAYVPTAPRCDQERTWMSLIHI